MGCVERVITVATPREKVWRFLADFTTTEEWDPPTLLTERTSGDGGVGTTYRNVATVHGERTEFDYVVTEFVEHERLQLHGRSRLLHFVDTITLAEAPGGGTTSPSTPTWTPTAPPPTSPSSATTSPTASGTRSSTCSRVRVIPAGSRGSAVAGLAPRPPSGPCTPGSPVVEQRGTSVVETTGPPRERPRGGALRQAQGPWAGFA
ncbi:hypothetical protein GCM10023340_11460 [Nocardioides marinquilinus]|uniref:Polyketide cyclase n=1 Tax=Nocardioides marinquilinus TaxID=1210400 RepID=A0ABP9PIF4_9ACTN